MSDDDESIIAAFLATDVHPSLRPAYERQPRAKLLAAAVEAKQRRERAAPPVPPVPPAPPVPVDPVDSVDPVDRPPAAPVTKTRRRASRAGGRIEHRSPSKPLLLAANLSSMKKCASGRVGAIVAKVRASNFEVCESTRSARAEAAANLAAASTAMETNGGGAIRAGWLQRLGSAVYGDEDVFSNGADYTATNNPFEILRAREKETGRPISLSLISEPPSDQPPVSTTVEGLKYT